MATKEQECRDCPFKSQCFKQLGDLELQSTSESKVQVNYKSGETIVKQGSFVTHMLYVKQGLVKVYQEVDSNRNLIYQILPEGSFIGLSNLFTRETYPFSVAALGASDICSIDRKILEQLVYDNGSFAHSVMRYVNEETHQLRSKLISLTHKQTRGRLSDSLIYLCREVFDALEFPFKLSRNDLAEFSGMSMMSVVRTMQEFIRQGYVVESKGYIKVKDMAALERMAKAG